MFNCEKSALKFAGYTDQELLDEAFKVLEVMFPGKANIRESMVDYRRTKWTKNPYARMCYTYLGVNSTPADCSLIATPLDDKVFLTGEHTNFEFMGTVNAAYISGIKAAEKIIGIQTQNLASFLLCLIFVSTILSN